MDGEVAQGRRSIESPELSVKNFKLVRIIGTGTFGKVYLAMLNDKTYALKCLKKSLVIQMKQVEHIKSEKNLLADIYHPFIVNM